MAFTAHAMFRNLALAFVVIALVIGAIAYVATRDDRSTRGSSAVVGRPAGDAASSRARDGGLTPEQARRALAEIAEASHALMPPGYEALYISMPLDVLRRARPAIRRGGRAQSEASETWEEDDPSGARVIYVVGRGSQLLEQVQFASRIENAQTGLAPHFAALQSRYQSPTGIWDCAQSENTSAVRRFTWRRPGASIMEAVLIVGQSASVTLVVAATDDVARALRRAQCHSVRTPEEIARFPIATELRGDRQDFVREVPR